MNVRFTPIHELSAALSEELTEFSPYTLPAFIALFEHLGGKAGYFLVDDARQTVAALAAVEFGDGIFRRMQALVDGLPAPLWSSPETKADVKEIRTAIAKAISRRKYLKSILTDYENLFGHDYGKSVLQVTSVIDLIAAKKAGGEFPPDKTLRSEIAKAVREGVRVEPLDLTVHMEEFVRLMENTGRRRGHSPRYSREFWYGFGKLAQQDRRLRISCVWAQDELAAAHVLIVDRETVLNWQIYFDKKYSSLKPNQAITAHAISIFVEEGVRYLNLGATPPDATGVEWYKSKWGGQDYRYQSIQCRSLLGRIIG